MTVEQVDFSADPRAEVDEVSGASWPNVTVVVPVHGDRGLLARTARALAAQDYPGQVDVVLADNGDNGSLRPAVEALPFVQLVSEERPGSYVARNTAVACARGEVLAFTDADCLPEPGWLRAAVRALQEQDGPAFVGGAVHLFSQDPARPTLAELWDSLNFLQQESYVTSGGWAATANMVTLRSTFDEVGPFDERLKSGGDREWGERASRLGVRAVYCAAAVVRHPARRRMSELHAKAHRVTRGDVETRRRAGLPMFDPGVLRAGLNPSLRSTYRRAGELPGASVHQHLRYVAVALWMRYYVLGAKVWQVLRTSGAAARRPAGGSR
ncbi:glycosyltransferase family 2 protein [Kineococcus auxinigenes]|uniref:glycosyltransferase n=1 Tax=unclassified Kineococcus TaxID=2621656 RepID=UPI003D7D731A